ncbi:MAG TPA: hypothetical protein VFZ09_18395 [Archangium sp.]|uniref:hypothetical protein n=1 Tax=Archangium sp. TaxID=1872627 RepID=UPI002E320F18|nr:hypothetical protein [Archangium sp.]HEX5748216.1 hypothetical protein [Archangium sp.]
MDELLALLERYAPGYDGRIEGYPDVLLDELEEVFGRPLPEVYRNFARCMGTRGGPLLAAVRSFDPLRDVAELYRLAPKGELPPRRFLFIFGDPNPLAPHHYWLDLESPSEEGDCQVVRMPFGADAWKTKLHREAIGLRELLFLWAMEHVHLPTLPHQASYLRREGHTAPGAEDIARLLEQMGFVRLPYPRYSMLFEREGAAARLYRSPDSLHFNLRVGMRHPEELKRFQMLLEDNTDLGRSPF